MNLLINPSGFRSHNFNLGTEIYAMSFYYFNKASNISRIISIRQYFLLSVSFGYFFMHLAAFLACPLQTSSPSRPTACPLLLG